MGRQQRATLCWIQTSCSEDCSQGPPLSTCFLMRRMSDSRWKPSWCLNNNIYLLWILSDEGTKMPQKPADIMWCRFLMNCGLIAPFCAAHPLPPAHPLHPLPPPRCFSADLFKYRLVNCKLINSTFLHNKEGCLLSDVSDENNAYMVYFVSFLGTLAVLPGNIVSALLMDKIGRLRMLGNHLAFCVLKWAYHWPFRFLNRDREGSGVLKEKHSPAL